MIRECKAVLKLQAVNNILQKKINSTEGCAAVKVNPAFAGEAKVKLIKPL
jgi:hypothetical protein